MQNCNIFSIIELLLVIIAFLFKGRIQIKQGKINTVNRKARIEPIAPNKPNAAIGDKLEVENESKPAAVVMLVKNIAMPV